MYKKLKAMFHKETMQIEGMGLLKLYNNAQPYWFGDVKPPFREETIELHIDVGRGEGLGDRIPLIRDFLEHYPELEPLLFTSLQKSFEKTGGHKTVEDLRRMYVLSALGLMEDGKSWSIVFEPVFDVETIYNFLPRFTVREGVVVWSNLFK